MITAGQKTIKDLRDAMWKLCGVVVALTSLANEGREDRAALDMIAHVVDDAFAILDEVADTLERADGADAEGAA